MHIKLPAMITDHPTIGQALWNFTYCFPDLSEWWPGYIIAAVVLWLVMTPTRVAYRRRDAVPWWPVLGIGNLFLGWTIFGYFICLLLAKGGVSRADPEPDFIALGYHRDLQTGQWVFVGPPRPPIYPNDLSSSPLAGDSRATAADIGAGRRSLTAKIAQSFT